MKDRWCIDVHPTGDEGVVVGIFSTRTAAERKANAIHRAAGMLDIETSVFRLTDAQTPAALIVRSINGEWGD